MSEKELPIAMYIASANQASEFKSRCQPLFQDVRVATLSSFGKENPHDSFLKINQIMRDGGAEWTIFHWKDVSQLIGSQVFLKEIKELIGAGACKRSKTYIIDPDGTLSKKDGVSTFAAFGIGVLKDETEIGFPFSKMLTPSALELKRAGEENKAFEGITPPDYSGDEGRLPGMSSSTPSRVDKSDTDPFNDLATPEEDDPFASFDSKPSPQPVSDDPFADFESASGSSQNTSDIFSELDDDLGGADAFDDLGNSDDDLFDDGLFDMLNDHANETVANAGDVDDPFADFDDISGADSFKGGADAFDDGDPFADFEDDMIALDKANGVDVEEFIGGVGGVMDGTSVAEDVIGSADDAIMGVGTAGNGEDDPFADFEDGGTLDIDGNDDEMLADMFDDFSNGDSSTGGDEVFDDPFGEMSDEDVALARQSIAGGGAMVPSAGNGIVRGGTGSGGIAGSGDPFAGKSIVSLDDIFQFYGDRLNTNDYNKLVGMLEPDWDYTMEAADGIGLTGGGAKGLLGGGGKKKAKNTYSQVEEYTLAESIYIRDMEAQNERYSPPDQCKCVTVHSSKGGSGKSILQKSKIIKINKAGNPEWTTVGEIKPGDKIFNRLGQPVEVESIAPQGKLEVYEITLRDGRVIECSGDHLWNVLHRGSNRSKNHHRDTYTTQELMEKSIFKNEGKGKQEYRWKIPVNDALKFPEQDLPLDPYLLGLLIGDGCFRNHHPEISTADPQIIKMIDEIISPLKMKCRKRGKQGYSWELVSTTGKPGVNPVRDVAIELGLWAERTEDKFIPLPYMRGSIEQRRALLQGLMDSDGTSNKGRFSFCTINAEIKDQFMSLVRSLGYTCSAHLDNRPEKYTTGECWNISIQTNDVENIFRLQRKKDDYYAYKAKQTPAKTLPTRKDPTLYTAENNNGLAPLNIADAPIHPYLLGMVLSNRVVNPYNDLKIPCRNDFVTGALIDSMYPSVAMIPAAWLGVTSSSKHYPTFILHHEGERAKKSGNKTALHLALADAGIFNDETVSVELRKDKHLHRTDTRKADDERAMSEASAAIAASPVRARQISNTPYTDEKGIHIPDAYMHGTPALRQALLQGIMDGAGIFAPSAALPALNTQRNPQFKAQFEDLVTNLGYSLHVSEAKNEAAFTIIATDDTSIFYSEDFIEQMHNVVDTKYQTKANTWMGNDDRYISITDIKKTGRKEEMTCLYVKDEEHLFLVGDYVVTHNSSIAVGLATQLNWYFNKELMQQLTTNYRSRVLILSLNEFDDIPVHGIGYEGFDISQDEDGKNVAELLRRIDDTNGNPSWDDIMHCFVSTEQNRVFYLPSLTQREMLEDNINITADDYRRVFEVCSKFFQFIVVDTPDIFYQEKNDLMNFVFAISDIICMIVEPDSRSITNLYHFFNGLEAETGRVPLNPAKCMLVVNKYVTKNNPYIVQPIGQLSYEDITSGTSRYFSRFMCIPFTQPRGVGNVLYGTDPKIKEAYADLADTVLEMISQNDAEEEQKKKKRQK